MSIASRARVGICNRPVFNHGITAFTRENSYLAFRWRPRLYLQLPRSRKPHPSSDLEWSHWTGSTYRISPFDHKHDYLLQKVETQTWTVDDTPAGTWVSSRNLTYVKVVSNTIFLFGANQTILHRSSTLHIWPGMINYMQRTT
jgi:hypothetical protein